MGIALREGEREVVDTSLRANFKPTAEINDLDALAKEVCRHLAASANATQNFLEHALAVGDALIRARAQIMHGEWLPWLKSCDLGEDTAERYMKLARHRAQLSSARVRNLSLSAALRLIAKAKPTNSNPTKKAKSAIHPELLAWWSRASAEVQYQFITQALGQINSRATELLRDALSANADGDVIVALGEMKRMLTACGYDPHDVELHLKDRRRLRRAA